MNRITPLFAIFIITLYLVLLSSVTSPQEKPIFLEVYFSPKGGCTEAIIRQLDKAKNTILIQAYSFTSAPIAKALLIAHKR